MGSIGIGILTDTALLYVEAGVTEEFLTEGTELLCRQLAHEQLLGVAAITRITARVAYFVHTSLVPLGCYAQRIAQVHGVHTYLLLHNHHDVVGRLIEDKKFTVAVGDGTSGRKEDMLEEGVAVCVLLEVLA